jgi:hypothetical protein
MTSTQLDIPNVSNILIILGFFFRVANTTANMKVTFNIINMAKPDSLYNYGMKVLIFSDFESRVNDKGWFRGGEKISYTENHFKMVRYQFN